MKPSQKNKTRNDHGLWETWKPVNILHLLWKYFNMMINTLQFPAKWRYFKQSREDPGDENCVAIFDSVSTWRTWTLIIRCFSVHELSWRKQGLYNMRLWLLSNIGFFSLLDCSYCHFVGARGLMASKWRGILQSSQVSLVIFCSYNNRNATGLWSYLKWVAVGMCTQMLIVDHSGSVEFV